MDDKMFKAHIVLQYIADKYNVPKESITKNNYSLKAYYLDLRPIAAQLMYEVGIDKMTISFMLNCFLKSVNKMLALELGIDDMKQDIKIIFNL